MNKKSDKITLSDLYKTSTTRDLVWRVLASEFEQKFTKLIERGELLESSLVGKAISKKFWIKELFIEYGLPLESLEDLKSALVFLSDLESTPQYCGHCDDTVN